MKTYLKTMLLILFVTVQNTTAQDTNRLLNTKEKNEVVLAIKTHLEVAYIDLELSKKMIMQLDKNLKSDTYNKITSPVEFAKTVTEDLQSISKDLHLKVRFEPERIAREKLAVSEEKRLEMEKRTAMQMTEINYGFTEVKIM